MHFPFIFFLEVALLKLDLVYILIILISRSRSTFDRVLTHASQTIFMQFLVILLPEVSNGGGGDKCFTNVSCLLHFFPKLCSHVHYYHHRSIIRYTYRLQHPIYKDDNTIHVLLYSGILLARRHYFGQKDFFKRDLKTTPQL